MMMFVLESERFGNSEIFLIKMLDSDNELEDGRDYYSVLQLTKRQRQNCQIYVQFLEVEKQRISSMITFLYVFVTFVLIALSYVYLIF